MLKKLKIKVVLLSGSALLILLVIMVGVMNVINFSSVTESADGVLELISQGGGRFPEFDITGSESGGRPPKLPNEMSPETPYESRYFSVTVDTEGIPHMIDTSRIVSVTEEDALAYAEEALCSERSRGYTDRFRYYVSPTPDGSRVTFLDVGRQLDMCSVFLLASSGIALIGFVIAMLIISFFAGRIVKPIAEGYEKQKRFITDAGHELKTPLTIINANADLLAMDIGDCEALTEIKAQTGRLKGLTEDLVYLSKLEEPELRRETAELPLSEVVSDAAAAFEAPAKMRGMKFTCSVEPMISAVGDVKAINQLVCILMDNALKYSPVGAEIGLALSRQAHTSTLTVTNPVSEAMPKQELERLFDRFYRADASRSSGGYGIGLSVARAIVRFHGGKISASTDKDGLFKITVIFQI